MCGKIFSSLKVNPILALGRGHRTSDVLSRQSQLHKLVLPVLFVSLLAYFCCLTDDLFPGGDNARYLVLAESLATGQGYHDVSRLSQPIHYFYPPGFPLLLTPVVALFGLSPIAAKAWVGTFSVLSCIVVYRLFQPRYGSAYASIIAMLYSLAPVVFMYSRRVYSDLPFTALTLLGIIAFEEYTRQKSSINWQLIIVAVLFTGSFYLRPMALTIVLAGSLWLITKSKVNKLLALLVIVTLTIAPWYYWSRQIDPSSVGHFPAFYHQDANILAMIERVVNNARLYSRLLSENFLYIFIKGPEFLDIAGTLFSLLASVATFTITALALIGFVAEVIKRRSFVEFYFAIYVATLLVYSFVIDRFTTPILPFAISYCVQGMHITLSWWKSRFKKWVQIALLAIVMVSLYSHIAGRIYQEKHFATFAPEMASLYDLARWARHNLEPTAVVITEHPDFFYIYSKLRTIDQKSSYPHMETEIEAYITLDEDVLKTLSKYLEDKTDEGQLFQAPLYCSIAADLCIYRIPASLLAIEDQIIH